MKQIYCNTKSKKIQKERGPICQLYVQKRENWFPIYTGIQRYQHFAAINKTRDSENLQ